MRVKLFRDSFDTPWGFRLQGGRDLNQPLVVQRVFSNTPAEGELQRGDIFLEVNGRDAAGFTHKQALDQIKFGGGQIELLIERPATPKINPLHPTSPTRAPSNLPPVQPGAIQIPIKKRPDPVYAAPSMPHPQNTSGHQPKKITLTKFGGGTTSYGSNYATPGGRKGARPFQPTSQDYVDFGVDYTKIKKQPELPRFQPSAAAPPPPPAVQHRPAPYTADTTQDYNRPPAWSSSLRSSDIPKPWEMEQQDTFMPVQNTPQRGAPVISPKPTSPRPQAQGKQLSVRMSSTATSSPGATTKTGDRDWSESHVYRMLHDQHAPPPSHAAPMVNTKPPPPPMSFKPAPPAPAPPAQRQQQYQPPQQNDYNNFDESYGTSDF